MRERMHCRTVGGSGQARFCLPNLMGEAQAPARRSSPAPVIKASRWKSEESMGTDSFGGRSCSVKARPTLTWHARFVVTAGQEEVIEALAVAKAAELRVKSHAGHDDQIKAVFDAISLAVCDTSTAKAIGT